jgi:hypothetical protein
MERVLNGWLFAGGLASATASALHFLCMPGGGRWYRAMSAGERMSHAVNRGEWGLHASARQAAGVGGRDYRGRDRSNPAIGPCHPPN